MGSDTVIRSGAPLQRPELVLGQAADSHSLTDPATGAVQQLNETALALWQLCDGRTTAQEMVAAVAALFDADDVALERDVYRTLTEFDRLGLITWVERAEGEAQ